MKIIILVSFLIKLCSAQLCFKINDCNSKSFCDFSINICKCKGLYYGANCETKNLNTSFTISKSNVVNPFIIGFSVGYTFLFAIGLSIIYLYFKYYPEKEDSTFNEKEEVSKIYMDKEYYLTQNKNIDTEANFNVREIITEEVKKEEVKAVDNSYKLVNKNVDPEANLEGFVRTEEQNIIQQSEENENRL